MALALPTVAFDTPVSREYLDHWGVYAEPGNPMALARRWAPFWRTKRGLLTWGRVCGSGP
jgi:hypothetical protein